MAESTNLWKKCEVVIDEPIRIEIMGVGFEADDFMIMGGLMAGLLLVLPPMVWFMTAVGIPLLIYRAKRGKPLGAIWHWLHANMWWKIPGVLSPLEVVYDPQ